MTEHIRKHHIEQRRNPPYPYAPFRLAEHESATPLTTFVAYSESDGAQFVSSASNLSNSDKPEYTPFLAEFIAGISILRGSEGKIDPTSVGVCLWANLIHIGTLHQLSTQKEYERKTASSRTDVFYDKFPENVLCRGPRNKAQLQRPPCTNLIAFDTARLVIRLRRSQKINGFCEVLSLKSQCHVCEFLSTHLELDLTPLEPETNQCEWFEAPQERTERCKSMKFHPSARFCFEHVRQWRFWSLENGKGHMIGTHLESVTQIRTAFETLHVEGPATALDKLRDAMENNIAECNSQKKVARARFIDTEFNPRTQHVWQIAILDSDMEPIVVAIIDNVANLTKG